MNTADLIAKGERITARVKCWQCGHDQIIIGGELPICAGCFVARGNRALPIKIEDEDDEC